jgi:hypothetical protein
MGTWICHLRIAENLLTHLNGVVEVPFAFGNLAPDSGLPNADWSAFDPPKEVTHFLPAGSGENNVQDLIFYRDYLLPCDRAQDPERYSFLLGYFLHLVTDRLWSEKIGKPSMEVFADLFADHSEFEAFNIIKEDWYDLDLRYVRDHPQSLFWRAILPASIPPCPIPFISQAAFEQQMSYIRGFYSQGAAERKLDRVYPYLNEATMQRFVNEVSESLNKLLRLLAACPPPERLQSATLLLTSAETAAFLPPLGD